MNKSNSYVQLSLLSVTVLLFGMFVFSNVYAQETVSITTSISPITILFDEFISLLDTSTTGNLTSISVTANLPCNSSNTPLLTIVAGILGDTTNVIDSSSDFIGNGPRDTCVFRDNITNVTAANIPAINTVFLNHTGSSPVHIPQGVMVTLSGVFANQTAEPISSFINATGGTITYFGGKTIHTFTSSGTFEIIAGSGDVDYLVVAGGGGTHDNYSAGGGAGGFRTGTGHSITAQAYTITVGAGGLKGATDSATNGGDSTFDTITSIGGGSSLATLQQGRDGGSGSGGRYGENGGDAITITPVSSETTTIQGYRGGHGSAGGGDWALGGGGGCLEVGETAPSNTEGGDGADGCTSSISGSAVIYSTGGGGGSIGVDNGVGGSSNVNNNSASNSEITATANTGSGAGGGIHDGTTADGNNGGSGIVIISYDTP